MTGCFEGPLSFSSMAAQVLLHFQIRHERKGSADWEVAVTGERGAYTVSISREGKTAYQKQGCRDRRDAEHAMMDGFSALTGRSLGKWGYLLGMRPEKALCPFLKMPDWEEKIHAFLQQEKVDPSMADLLMEAGRRHRDVMAMEPAGRETASLYIHVPFCPSHCVYCSFPAAVVRPGQALKRYTEALCRDIRAAGAIAREKGFRIESVYMGGGTPSVLTPPQMEQVLRAVHEGADIPAGTEWTVEAGRPDTISSELLEVLAAYGVNRLSVNPQTMQDRILKKISRSHGREDIFRAYELVRRYPFRSVNMDFICGLPSQTEADMEENLAVICQLQPENVTIHTLAVKRGSPFFGREQEFDLPPAASVDHMIGRAQEVLRREGYHPYYLYRQKYMTDDFANVGYAKDGHDSVYNIQMIGERQHVLGCGAGASVKAVLPGGFRLRKLYMPRDPALYESRLDALIESRNRLWDIL